MTESLIYITAILLIAIGVAYKLLLRHVPSGAERQLLNYIANMYDSGTAKKLAFSLKPAGFYCDGKYQGRPFTASFGFVGQYRSLRRALVLQINCRSRADLQVSDHAFAEAMVIDPSSPFVRLRTLLLPEKCQNEVLPQLQKLFLELKIERFHLQPLLNGDESGASGPRFKNLSVIMDAIDIRSEPHLLDHLLPAIKELADTLEKLTGA